MSDKQKQAAAAAQETTVEASLIDQIVDEGRGRTRRGDETAQ